ncbi:PEP-CTERM sorting domain-containing protein [Verrucomicrobiaceae bacterium 5K15]|uniref:PEP-CTERM sorting domain-containing protein n=1 Tax=Oceaniferula flava TaxID=2800421 RepID=A0AAE2SBU1_9BACT|nr:PEP-CTERM sorting domain-containing protein [Oceaniferula flavus]MBK1853401.1 PEP-CTERM sorting domain-containing protein [Oceaniferula flavus]MBM1134706.1 PEP-CTERM sorting domain-containing protein [Oceaniferula flavus]
MKQTIFLVTVMGLCHGSLSAASIIAVNFMRSATVTPAANDGSEYGIDTWVDVESGDTNLTTDGVSMSWGGGSWSGGSSNNIENGYIDNATAITITGLSSWLTANGASGYTVQLSQASDTSTNWFGDTLINDTSGGALLDTLTNPNIQNGLTTVSSSITSDTLYVDTTTTGTAPSGGASARTNIAGIIITAVPEPSSALMAMLGAGLFLFQRKRRR